MKKTVCVDLDGVLADYGSGWQGLDHIGEPIPGAVEFTRVLSAFADVVIFTCRCTEEMAGRNGLKAHMLRKKVAEWLDRHGFAYADIYTGQGKPIASAYIDDRGVDCRPEVMGQVAFDVAMDAAKRLCGVSGD